MMSSTLHTSSSSDVLPTSSPGNESSDLQKPVLAELYRLERLIAKGGMGAIYEATQLRMGGRVAIKFLGDGHRTEPEVLRRFREEAHILARLKHPHIITILDAGDDPDRGPFLVTELLTGQDLEAYLWEAGPLQFTEARHIAIQVGGALQAAHNLHVVHRDIKPQNLFVATSGIAGADQLIVKVIDFGVSKVVNRLSGERTAPMTAIGTPQYMAPETARGLASEADGRSDQFSLAVVLYRALSGCKPFDAPEPMAVMWQVIHVDPPPLPTLVPSIPSGAAQAIHRALSKDPSDRFESIADFVRAFVDADNLLGSVPPSKSLSCPSTLITRSPLPLPTPTPSSQSTFGSGAAESTEPQVSGASRRIRLVAVAFTAVLMLTGSGLVLSRRTEPQGQRLDSPDRLVRAHTVDPVVRLIPTLSGSLSIISTAASVGPSCAVPSVKCISGSGLSDRDRQTVFKLLQQFKLGVCPQGRAVIYQALDGNAKVKGHSKASVKWRKTDVERFWSELEGSMEFGRQLPDITVDGPGRGSCAVGKGDP